MARVGLVLVGAVLVFCALWLTNQPTPPTPTEIDAARMQRLGEWFLRETHGNYPAGPAGGPDLWYFVKRAEIEGRDDMELLCSSRTGDQFPGSPDDVPYEAARVPSLDAGRPLFWDKHDDPDGYRLVVRLAAVEGGGWTVVVERMRAEEVDKLCERYELEVR